MKTIKLYISLIILLLVSLVTYKGKSQTATISIRPQYVDLSAATALRSSYTIVGEFTGVAEHDLTETYIVLAYNQSSLICASTTELTTGQFTIACPMSEEIDKVEIRTLTNDLVSYIEYPTSKKNRLGIIRASEAPWCSIIPAQGTINVPNTIIPSISVNVPIRKLDNTELVDANIKDVVTFTKKSGELVAHTATISEDKMLITLAPDASLELGVTYAITISGVEDYSDSEAAPQSSNFTIEGVIETNPPVAVFTPGDKEINVSIAVKPTIVFNEAIYNSDQSIITDANAAHLLTLKENNASGNNVAFTAKISADKRTITITPSASLSYSSSYYLGIDNVSDNNGNIATAQSIVFKIEEEPDNTPPVAVFNPSTGTSNVSISIFPSITFDEPVYEVGGNEMTNAGARSVLYFRKGNASGVDVPFIVSVAPDKMSFLLRPQNLLEYDQLYYVHLKILQDAGGNQTDRTQIVTFRTASKPDQEPPIVTFMPADKTVNVPVGILPTITFNEQVYNEGGGAVDNASAFKILSLKKDNASGVDVPIIVMVSPDLTSFLIRPKILLAYSTTYYLELGVLQDALGNQTEIQSITFTTEVSPDNTAPIATFTPADATTNVSIGVFPTIVFDEQVFTIGGGAMTNAAAKSLLKLREGSASGSEIPFVVAVGVDKDIFTLMPNDQLNYSTTYYLELQPLQDAAGNATVAQSISFTTEANPDTEPPVATFSPADLTAEIPVGVLPTISFSEQVYTVGGAPVTNVSARSLLRLKKGNATGVDVPFRVLVSPDRTSFLIQPTLVLAYSSTYYLELQPLADAVGNATAVQSITFTTVAQPDNAPPAVHFYPADKEIDVSINAYPSIDFDEQVFTIGGGNMTHAAAKSLLKLRKDNSSGIVIPFNVSVGTELKTFILMPIDLLRYSTTYYLELQPLQDAAGNATVAQSISFTTEAIPDTEPPVATFSPADLTAEIPVGVLPTISFSEQVYTVGGAPVTNVSARSLLRLKKGNAIGVDVPFRVLVSPDRTSFLIQPTLVLAYSSTYYLELQPLADGAGNATAVQSITFTTVAQPDNAPPAVTFYPANGEVDVPISLVPNISFDEQVFTIGGGGMTAAAAKSLLSFKKDNASGANVPFTVGVAADQQSFVVRPLGLLKYSTTYYLELQPLQDAAGNATVAQSVSFTTEANPDTEPPLAIFTPADMMAEVSIGVFPTITFSEQVYTTGGTPITNTNARSLLSLRKGSSSGVDVPFRVFVSPDRTSFFIQPLGILAYSNTYYLELQPLADGAGNTTTVQSITFTTVVQPDNEPPAVVFYPGNAEANVAISVVPIISFDEQVFTIGGGAMTNAAAKSLLSFKKGNVSGASVPFTVGVSADNRSFVLTPISLLEYGTTYYLELQPLQDGAGNATLAQSISFTTAANPDTGPPVANFIPVDLAQDVVLGVLPSIIFDEQVYTVGGAPVTNANVLGLIRLRKGSASGPEIRFRAYVSPNRTSFLIQPFTILEYNTTYYLELQPLKDGAGNQTSTQSITFTTLTRPDKIPPVVTFYPANEDLDVSVGVVPTISFDEQVFAEGGVIFTNATAKAKVRLKKSDASGIDVPFTVEVNPNLRSFVVRPLRLLDYASTYYLELQPVQDASGNLTITKGIRFTTETSPDMAPPAVTFYPTNGEANVAVGVLPILTFNEQVFAIGGAEMTDNAAKAVLRLRVNNAAGANVPFTVMVATDKKSFIIRPLTLLGYNQAYYLELQPIQDKAGNTTSLQAVTFTTAANPDLQAPLVVIFPVDGATDVPVEVVPSVVFSEQVYNSGGELLTPITASSVIRLTKGSATGEEVDFTIVATTDLKSFFLQINGLLEVGTTYFLEVQPVRDAMGNLSELTRSTFTTGMDAGSGNEANIVSGVVENQVGTTFIDRGSKTVTMVTGASSNLSHIIVQLIISKGATITPNPRTITDYSLPVKYIVTSKDGSINNSWLVRVIKDFVTDKCPYHMTFIPGTNILQLCYEVKIITGVEVFTTDGRRIYSNHSFNSTSVNIDMSLYSGGIYIIRVFDKNGAVIETSKVLR